MSNKDKKWRWCAWRRAMKMMSSTPFYVQVTRLAGNGVMDNQVEGESPPPSFCITVHMMGQIYSFTDCMWGWGLVRVGR